MRLRIIPAVAVCAALSACATAPHVKTHPPPRQNGATPSAPPPQPAPPPESDNAFHSTGNPAVVALLDEAEVEQHHGRLEDSTESLERALDIEPQNPFLWHRLAILYLARGQAGQAMAMARKSNSLISGNKALKAKNWHAIAQARRLQGDTRGAEKAEAKAQALHE